MHDLNPQFTEKCINVRITASGKIVVQMLMENSYLMWKVHKRHILCGKGRKG